ncbi:pesticin C-terminus-like muramidase [Teredinibacter sp. KSP-S5-2]|uniref:pesticin C-terminus-like muramidase n=1 Tax=Teredinibacter sp. KSP-S5-2 TaxID=3034506 RepID=UPI0029351889|nr:pesticin C-terminus-like muramidase [Teredinibacter sp. KSP-S5-2]WNO10538.1 pesticin C-terminus-like muramidase [Teredinibacter sp. KSP-S5-2]
MPVNIDYDFIQKLEGGCQTQGYVPDPESSRSGVTIATGFDLGQRTKQDLIDLGLNAFLVNLLSPYCGYQGEEAEAYLKNHPLKISNAQAELIDFSVKTQHTLKLEVVYNASIDKDKIRFSALPSPIQTVIASVSFQYGIGLKKRAPKFWQAITEQDWKRTLTILLDFEDRYTTRRNQEARLLMQVV